VIDLPGDHPPPHAELTAQHPLIFTVPAGGVLYRHHQKNHDPVYFGKKGDYRFDDPPGSAIRFGEGGSRQGLLARARIGRGSRSGMVRQGGFQGRQKHRTPGRGHVSGSGNYDDFQVGHHDVEMVHSGLQRIELADQRQHRNFVGADFGFRHLTLRGSHDGGQRQGIVGREHPLTDRLHLVGRRRLLSGRCERHDSADRFPCPVRASRQAG